jgi:SOS response regulatory protein OraA/RecX
MDKEYQKSFQYVAYLLSLSSYPSWILKEKLTQRAVSLEVQEQILENCARMLLFDDEKWIEQYIEKYKQRGEGPFKIRARLSQKHTPFDKIHTFLESHYGEDEQLAVILLALNNLKIQEIHKVKHFFYKKGFSIDIIESALMKHKFML